MQFHYKTKKRVSFPKKRQLQIPLQMHTVPSTESYKTERSCNEAKFRSNCFGHHHLDHGNSKNVCHSIGRDKREHTPT